MQPSTLSKHGNSFGSILNSTQKFVVRIKLTLRPMSSPNTLQKYDPLTGQGAIACDAGAPIEGIRASIGGLLVRIGAEADHQAGPRRRRGQEGNAAVGGEHCDVRVIVRGRLGGSAITVAAINALASRKE